MILFFANIYYTANTYGFLRIAFAYYHIINRYIYRYYGHAGDCQPFLFMYIITAVYWTIL